MKVVLIYWIYEMAEKNLKQLAIDISENKVFGTFNIREDDIEINMPMVFIPIALMNQKQKQKIIDEETVHIYEHMDKAGYRSVNGMPCFLSMNCINKEDWIKVVKYIKEYEVKVKSFLNKEENKT